jgi:hypothetical protein
MMKAYGAQLLARPWTSQLGPLIPAGWIVAAVVLWPALRVLPWATVGVVVACVLVGVLVFVAVITAVAIGLVFVMQPVPARRTAYLLRDSRGRACVVLHGTDGLVWESKSLAAWPAGRGLGSSLGTAIIAEAHRSGAEFRLWSTRYLEPTYSAWGFTTVRRRWGMRLMHRPAASNSQS